MKPMAKSVRIRRAVDLLAELMAVRMLASVPIDIGTEALHEAIDSIMEETLDLIRPSYVSVDDVRSVPPILRVAALFRVVFNTEDAECCADWWVDELYDLAETAEGNSKIQEMIATDKRVVTGEDLKRWLETNGLSSTQTTTT